MAEKEAIPSRLPMISKVYAVSGLTSVNNRPNERPSGMKQMVTIPKIIGRTIKFSACALCASPAP